MQLARHAGEAERRRLRLAAGAHDSTVGGLALMLGVLAVPATDRKNKPTNKGRITID